MSFSENMCIFAGNMTRDPELKTSNSGTSFVNFSIAVNDPFKGKDGQTEFINVTAFQKTAENVAKYCAKGSGIYVVGRLQSRKYTDKNGVERTSFDIIADRVRFIGNRREGMNGDERPVSAPQSYNRREPASVPQTPAGWSAAGGMDEIPF